MPEFQNRRNETLWYEDSGAGMPLVFLHGWCMSSAVWGAQFRGCQDSFRVIAPDLRGHGRSRAVSAGLDFESFASDLVDLLRQLDLSRVILVGWSMGAQVALQAYRDLSDRLAGLVLVSATPCFTATDGFCHGLARNEVSGMRLKVDRNLRRALDGFYSRMFAEGELEGHPAADEIRRTLASIHPPQSDAAREAIDALASADMRPLLAEIRVPALIMHGDHDRICLPGASRYLAAAIRGAGQYPFVGCGHAPFMTRPQQFNDEISRFARSLGE